jgi:chemotaxis protein MotB
VSRRGRHGRHQEAHEEENSERWLLTYSDMITLLLALFIVLFAASTISEKKFLALAIGLRQSFNPTPGVLSSGSGLLNNPQLGPAQGLNNVLQHLSAPVTGQSGSTSGSGVTTTTTTTTLPPGTPAQGTAQPGEAPLAQIQAQITQALAAKGLQGNVSSSLQTRGLVVQVLADKVFFATGSADLGSEGDVIVDTIASVLQTDTNGIDVEGYTDDQPIYGGPYSSNEELSAVRAVNVALRLFRNDGISQSRVAATGFGEAHPAAPNDNPADMALNRRIDIVVLAPGQVQP